MHLDDVCLSLDEEHAFKAKTLCYPRLGALVCPMLLAH